MNDAAGRRAPSNETERKAADDGSWIGESVATAEPSCWIGRDLPPIHIDGEEFFLVSHHGELFLLPNRCPHRGGSLKFGFVNGREEIVCPMHHNAFPIARLIERPGARRLRADPR